jgi:CBS-domain-containing membrane protein
VTVAAEESLDVALQRMAKEQVRRLPVVSDGRLVGILPQAEVARKASAESTGTSSRRYRPECGRPRRFRELRA